MNKRNNSKLKTYFIILIIFCLIFVPFKVKISASCSWKLLNTPSNMNPVYSVTVDPNNSDIVYLGTRGKLYKSTDGGNSWATINISGSFMNVSSIVFNPSNSKNLYVGGSGLYKSDNSGESWTKTGYILTEVTKIVINPAEPEQMYAIDAGQLYKSFDGGETWFRDLNLTFYSLYDIALDPENPDTLYAATNKGLLKQTTINHVSNWSVVNSSSIKCLVIDPQNANILYIGAYSGSYKGIYKSTDGGKNWFEIDNGISFSNNKMTDLLVIDPNNTNVLYSLINGVGLYKSVNGGNSWNFMQDEIASNIYIRTVTIDPNDSDIIYIGAANQQNGKAAVYKHQCNVSYSLKLNIVGQGEVLKNPEKDKYQEGESVTLTAIPKEGWTFVSWSGNSTSTNSSINITMGSNKNITATFAINTYTITASSGFGGSISPSGTVTVNSGESKTFTIIPDAGYHTTDVKVDEVSVGAISSYTLHNITANHTITASFEKNQQNIIVKLQIGSKIMMVNGQATQVDVEPEIKNGRTFLPLRAICEAFGSKVEWFSETRAITITLGKNDIALQIGNITGIVNGSVKTLDAAPYIKNSRTMVPLRFIVEGLGAKVDWEADTRTVTITLANTHSNQLPVAAFTANPISGTAPLEVTFDASSSHDPDGSIVSYSWDFKDGTIGNGKTVKHTFTSATSYSVKLTVTDNSGATSSTTKNITVSETVNFCQIGVPYTAPDGLTVTLNSLAITEKSGSYQYTINYTLANNTKDKAIEEGTFKMYYKNESGGLPQYGFFGKLFPGDTKTRTYTFEEVKSKPFGILEYSSDNFFRAEPLANSLKWNVPTP